MRCGGEGDRQLDCLAGDDCVRGCERAEGGVMLPCDLVLAAGPLVAGAWAIMTWPRAVMGDEAAMGVTGEIGGACR